MFGTFQQSQLRIEVPASANVLNRSLTHIPSLREWLMPLPLESGLPESLTPGLIFHSGWGIISVAHQVNCVGENHLRLLLSQGVDGFHEWTWGDGWVQSRLEGISLLSLNLAQSLCLWRLKQYAIKIDSPTMSTYQPNA